MFARTPYGHFNLSTQYRHFDHNNHHVPSMKNKLALILVSVAAIGSAAANQGLYYIGSEADTSMPLKWVVGADLTYDDNVAPGGINAAGKSVEDSSGAISPYVGASFVSMTPQTTWDVYGRLGCIYYFDKPEALGTDDFYTEARVGANLTHRFDERLRLVSRNFLSYETEPDYSYGYAGSRQVGEYLYWQTDNALGYRWTELLGTYTGFSLTGLSYPDAITESQDRFTWMVYNDFRYQLNQQTVLTLTYRYAQTSAGGVASDSTDQYLLVGMDREFSKNTIMIARLGAQFRDVDLGDSATSPYLEFTLRSQVNEQLMVRAFTRYGFEVYDTVQAFKGGIYDYDQRQTLRIGLSGEYKISQKLTAFSGLDLIFSDMSDGRRIPGSPGPADPGGANQELLNVYLGFSLKFTDNLYGTVSYNYTNSNSDFQNEDYDRNRVSLGVRYEF